MKKLAIGSGFSEDVAKRLSRMAYIFRFLREKFSSVGMFPYRHSV